MKLLELRDFRVRYGAVEVVHGIHVEVNEGEAVTLIGPNGAGKTSTLLGLVGMAQATGKVRFNGKLLPHRTPEQLHRDGIVLVPEGRELFPTLTVEDHLRLGAFSRIQRGAPRSAVEEDLEWVYTLFPRLRERRRQLAGTLSGGEQQMLAIGRALMSRPRLLLLDEPSLGLAPLVVREIFRVLGELLARGTTMLLVEQNARMALQLADRAYVLEAGEVIAQGPPQTLLQDPRVAEAYLGLRRVTTPTGSS
ncbi:MAG: ABC transporter ATP-binding protein [Armatimonadota bacterium]|nr:ABC transporter ATP-binding protein [Armatimonadota bacterium]MDR7438429.1 ABC transporter ATP-binding protein [Armatimonadota bacterium]MDR7562228.1 ABC transporter ATP-binding protein [Armatimonadota bacterium]MDR7567469.1 ABC transporter ATP-binding protein [Armatimonadota bacterium]MDR7601273.1 ABC transporter ATP-binding protein [Armatimonadota bacterium]